MAEISYRRHRFPPAIIQHAGIVTLSGLRPRSTCLVLTARLVVPENRLPQPRCQVNVSGAEASSGGTRDHAAVTAFLHWFAASGRKIRSVEREMRWRWRLKTLWMAACTLRNRWAERADLTD